MRLQRIARGRADPLKREKQREQKRLYDAERHKTYAEHKRLAALTHYYNNREARLASIREWQNANPDLVAAYKNTNKSRRRASTSEGMTGAELLAWKAAQPKVCYWCSKPCPKKYHVDHYSPLSKGGAHAAENLVIACSTCNLRKHAKDPLVFAREVGRLL